MTYFYRAGGGGGIDPSAPPGSATDYTVNSKSPFAILIFILTDKKDNKEKNIFHFLVNINYFPTFAWLGPEFWLIQYLRISRLKASASSLFSNFLFLIVSSLMFMYPSAMAAMLPAEIAAAKRTVCRGVIPFSPPEEQAMLTVYPHAIPIQINTKKTLGRLYFLSSSMNLRFATSIYAD